MFEAQTAIDLPLQADNDGVIRVGGTRVTLQAVIADFLRGYAPEQIAEHGPVLKAADLYVMIGYYLANRADVDVYIAEERALAAQARMEYEQKHPQTTLRAR